MHLSVTGASGLLGLNLSLVAFAQGYQVTGLSHTRLLKGVPFDLQQVDLLKIDHALITIAESRPDAIIHCAAIADLNTAESAPSLAYQLNCEAAGALAEAAFRWGIPFLHISTDAVFNGRTGGYREHDLVNPLSVYAKSKLAGEQLVMDKNPEAIIARVVFFGWSLSGERSLAEFFFNNLRSGNRIKGFTDTYFSPLYVEDLAEILLEMITAEMKGLYHVVSPQHLSKYDFGVLIARTFGFDPGLIEPVSMHDVKRGAERSMNLVLRSEKLQAALGHPLPSVDNGIERFYQRWLENYPLQLRQLMA